MTQADITNKLYYGDNLDILRRYIPDESVDLIYLDPPFNSNRDYNVIFKDESGNKSDAELVAFEDTWHWGPDAERQSTTTSRTPRANEGRVPEQVSTLIGALRHGIGTNQMMAYLVEMAARLVELHRVLSPTGSLYLHCDPTASHYLKILLDAIFGPSSSEPRSSGSEPAHTAAPTDMDPFTTRLLVYYAATSEFIWNPQHMPYDPDYLKSHYNQVDPDGRRWTASDLTAAGTRNGSSAQPWRGYDPGAKGNHWKFTIDNIERLDAEGRLYWPKTGGWPRYRRYLDEVQGTSLQDVWTDIPPVNAQAAERLGYPTQKPLALLERIIEASSNPGDIILDPFCGCGTALVAAEKLGRSWIGIDITYLSIAVMKARLKDSFGLADVEIVGQPTEVEGARPARNRARRPLPVPVVGARPCGRHATRRPEEEGRGQGHRRGDHLHGRGWQPPARYRQRQERPREQRYGRGASRDYRARESRHRPVHHSRRTFTQHAPRSSGGRFLAFGRLERRLRAHPDTLDSRPSGAPQATPSARAR